MVSRDDISEYSTELSVLQRVDRAGGRMVDPSGHFCPMCVVSRSCAARLLKVQLKGGAVLSQIMPPAGEASPFFRTEGCSEPRGTLEPPLIPFGNTAKMVFERFPVPDVITERVGEVRHSCGSSL